MKRTTLLVMVMMLATVIISSCTKEETPDTTTETTYTSKVAPIIANYCLTCHSDVAPSADLSLTTYESVKAATMTGNLAVRINDANSPMPPSGLMPEDSRNTIQAWISGGYKE